MKYTIKQLNDLVLSKLSSKDLCKRYYNQLGGACPCCKHLGCLNIDKNYLSDYIKCNNCKDFFVEVGYNLKFNRLVLKLNLSKERIDLQYITFYFDNLQIKEILNNNKYYILDLIKQINRHYENLIFQ